MPSYSCPKLELKYCERCGGLWLRPQGSEAVYCAACAEAMRELPAVPRRGGGPSSGTVHAACLAGAPSVPVLPAAAESLAGARL